MNRLDVFRGDVVLPTSKEPLAVAASHELVYIANINGMVDVRTAVGSAQPLFQFKLVSDNVLYLKSLPESKGVVSMEISGQKRYVRVYLRVPGWKGDSRDNPMRSLTLRCDKPRCIATCSETLRVAVACDDGMISVFRVDYEQCTVFKEYALWVDKWTVDNLVLHRSILSYASNTQCRVVEINVSEDSVPPSCGCDASEEATVAAPATISPHYCVQSARRECILSYSRDGELRLDRSKLLRVAHANRTPVDSQVEVSGPIADCLHAVTMTSESSQILRDSSLLLHREFGRQETVRGLHLLEHLVPFDPKYASVESIHHGRKELLIVICTNRRCYVHFSDGTLVSEIDLVGECMMSCASKYFLYSVTAAGIEVWSLCTFSCPLDSREEDITMGLPFEDDVDTRSVRPWMARLQPLIGVYDMCLAGDRLLVLAKMKSSDQLTLAAIFGEAPEEHVASGVYKRGNEDEGDEDLTDVRSTPSGARESGINRGFSASQSEYSIQSGADDDDSRSVDVFGTSARSHGDNSTRQVQGRDVPNWELLFSDIRGAADMLRGHLSPIVIGSSKHKDSRPVKVVNGESIEDVDLNWNIYLLDTVELASLISELSNLAASTSESDRRSCLVCMKSIVHLCLFHIVNVSKSDKLDAQHVAELKTLQTVRLVKRVYGILADLCLEVTGEEQYAPFFFSFSDYPFAVVSKRLSEYSDLLLSYWNRVLFVQKYDTSQISDELCNEILNFFFKNVPHNLSSLILKSRSRKFIGRQAIELLEAVRSTSESRVFSDQTKSPDPSGGTYVENVEKWNLSSPLDIFVLSVLYVERGEINKAMEYLWMLDVNLLVEYFEQNCFLLDDLVQSTSRAGVGSLGSVLAQAQPVSFVKTVCHLPQQPALAICLDMLGDDSLRQRMCSILLLKKCLVDGWSDQSVSNGGIITRLILLLLGLHDNAVEVEVEKDVWCEIQEMWPSYNRTLRDSFSAGIPKWMVATSQEFSDVSMDTVDFGLNRKNLLAEVALLMSARVVERDDERVCDALAVECMNSVDSSALAALQVMSLLNCHRIEAAIERLLFTSAESCICLAREEFSTSEQYSVLVSVLQSSACEMIPLALDSACEVLLPDEFLALLTPEEMLGEHLDLVVKSLSLSKAALIGSR